MNGYKLFCEDIKRAFNTYLNSERLSFKSEKWFKTEFCYEVVLENINDYYLFCIETAQLQIFIINKNSLEGLEIDNLIMFLHPQIDLKMLKKKYFNHEFYNELKRDGASYSEQARITVEHLLLGELTAYARIIEEYLNEVVLGTDSSWLTKYKTENSQLNVRLFKNV
jgi:hypothetical protein